MKFVLLLLLQCVQFPPISTARFQRQRMNHLPTNNPPEEMTKKDKSRAKFSQKTLIHIVPFALLVCALVLRIVINGCEVHYVFRNSMYLNYRIRIDMKPEVKRNMVLYGRRSFRKKEKSLKYFLIKSLQKKLETVIIPLICYNLAFAL